MHNRHKSQTDDVALVVAHCISSVYNLTKHFDLSLTFYSLKILNDLPDNLLFLSFFSVVLTPSILLVVRLWIPAFLYFAPRVRLKIDIKCYKSNNRIRTT